MKRAWVTLFTDHSYLPGVLALKRSLDTVQTAYPLIVMVTDIISEDARTTLRDAGCAIREVALLKFPDTITHDYASPQFAQVWPKLRVWEMTDLDLAVMMDADMLVTRNMDEVFDIDLPPGAIAACHACRCNPHRRKTYPADWVPENCGYTHSTPPLKPPFDMASPNDYFNAGLFVLRPDANVFAALQARLLSLDANTRLLFAEQDLLNIHFRGNWVMLPYIYNALKTLANCHAPMWHLDEVKNIHYILDKPWQVDPTALNDPDLPYRDVVAMWWDTYRSI